MGAQPLRRRRAGPPGSVAQRRSRERDPDATSILRSPRCSATATAASGRCSTSTRPITTGSGGSSPRRSRPKMVESLRPEVDRLVNDALDAVVARGTGEMDLIADLAFPLPFTVISEMLGMPTGRRDELRTWSHAVVKTLDPILTPRTRPTPRSRASDAMIEYVLEVIAAKRRDPARRSAVGADRRGGGRRHPRRAGAARPGDPALHRRPRDDGQPDRQRHARAAAPPRPARAPPGRSRRSIRTRWRSCSRFDSPVQFSRRITIRDLELHGQIIEAGSFVLTCLGAANRRPRQQWGETADELDLGREGAAQHVSFGSGVHHCLGAALARVEGRAAFGALVRRFPDLELTDDHPAWNGRVVLRGLDALDRSPTTGAAYVGLTLIVTVDPRRRRAPRDRRLLPDPSGPLRAPGRRLGLHERSRRRSPRCAGRRRLVRVGAEHVRHRGPNGADRRRRSIVTVMPGSRRPARGRVLRDHRPGRVAGGSAPDRSRTR